VGWFKRSLDQQIRLFYLPVLAGVLIALALMSELGAFRKVLLVMILFLAASVHWDLRDGGLISRGLYSRGVSYNARNIVTIGVAFVLVTGILAAADAFYTPLIMLYYIPIVLGALRGGHRMTLVFVGILGAGMFIYYQIGHQVYGRVYEEGNLYLLLFLALSLASGFIADRLRRAAVDLSALYETGRALNSTLNVSEIYALVLNIVSMDLVPDVSALFMIDSQKHLRLQAHRGLDDAKVKDLTIQAGRGLIGKVAETHAPMQASEFNRKWQLNFAPEIGSVMAVPLRVGEKLLGVLMVGRRAPHAYGYENLRFLEALGSQLGLAATKAEGYMTRAEKKKIDDEREQSIRSERLSAIMHTSVAVNHEINNPLTAILGNAQLLLTRKEHLDQETIEKLKIIEENALKIKEVTQNLLRIIEPVITEYAGGVKMLDIERSKKREFSSES